MRRAWIEILFLNDSSEASVNVALHAESVDRNALSPMYGVLIVTSLSMRRAWIEIGTAYSLSMLIRVALHAESVDRNTAFTFLAPAADKSLSMRRAWIEIRN